MKETLSLPNYDERIVLSSIPLSALESMITKILSIELEKIMTVEKSDPDINDKLTISEAAKYLRVSKVTIHKYKRNGVFNFYQTGKTVYFKKSEIDAALASKKKGAIK